MTRVLFAGYSGIDFATIAPVVPLLRERAVASAIMNRYSHAPSPGQLKGLTVFDPPDVSKRLLSPQQIEDALPAILDVSSIGHLVPLSAAQTAGLRYLRGWTDEYVDFVSDVLRRWDPDLVVASLGEAETAIIRRACDRVFRRHVCLVPQRYEFKSNEVFTSHGDAAYLVAGDFGRSRLAARGIAPGRIRVTGNPRFDALAPLCNSHEPASLRSAVRTILYPLQALSGERRVIDLLRRYVAGRRGVRLLLRPHPNLSRRSWLPFLRHVLTERVAIARRTPIAALLRGADVLVTMWSLTTLEALIVGLPVITWKSDILPDEMPFALRGDAMQARSYAELEHALDTLLFDAGKRRSWIEQHRDCYLPYTGILDGKSAVRVTEALDALRPSGPPA